MSQFSSLINPPTTIGQGAATTLDEPILTTILRDLKIIGIKLFYVLLPRGTGSKALRDWDLWGPFILCFILALLLSFLSNGVTSTKLDSDSGLVFSAVFVIVWVGAGVVTINTKLLGGKSSFFQSVCVLGYCIAPLVVAAFIVLIWRNIWFMISVVAVGFAWSTWASLGFLAEFIKPERKVIAIYPIFLFYMVIAWFIIIQP